MSDEIAQTDFDFPNERAEDLQAERQESIRSRAEQEALAEIMEKYARQQQGEAGDGEGEEAPLGTDENPIDAGINAGRMVIDAGATLGEWVVNLPSQTVGAVRDAAVNSMEGLDAAVNALGFDDLEKAMEDAGLPTGIFVGPEGLTFQRQGVEDGEDRVSSLGAFADLIPEFGDAEEQDSGTRKVLTFLAGLLGAKKVTAPLKALTGGPISRGTLEALRGGMAAFSAVEPEDNPLNSFGLDDTALSYDPEDSEFENRAKNALVESGFGVVADAAIGAGRAFRARRGARGAAKTIEQQLDSVLTEIDGAAKAQEKALTSLIGSPTDDLIRQGDGPLSELMNWSRIDSPDDVKRVMSDMLEQFRDEALEGRGARRSLSAVNEQALSVDATKAFDSLISRREIGGGARPLSDVEITAARHLYAASGEKLYELANIATADGGAMAKAALRKQVNTHRIIQNEIMGAKADASRALGAFRIPVGGQDSMKFLNEMDSLLMRLDEGMPIEVMANGIKLAKEYGGDEAMANFSRGIPLIDSLKAAGEKWGPAARQWWYFSLLSRFTTHIRNTVGNTLRIGMEAQDRAVAAQIGKLFGDQQVVDGEAIQFVLGAMEGAKNSVYLSSHARDVLKQSLKMAGARDIDGAAKLVSENADEFSGFWRSLVTGDSGFGIGRVDPQDLRGLSPEHLGYDPATNLGRVMRTMDVITSTSSKGLAAGDEIFKTANFTGELYATGLRRATALARSGEITEDAIEETARRFASDPDEALRALATKAAQTNTFTQRPEFNGKLWTFFRAARGIPIVGRLVMPFGQTPYNIGWEVIRRGPFAPLMSSFWDDIAAGGARQDMAWSRFLTGNMLLAALVDIAMDENTNINIIGDQYAFGADRGQVELDRRLGRSSMTVEFIDDEGNMTSIPFYGFEPAAYPIGAAANIAQILKSEEFDEDDPDIELLMYAVPMSMAEQMGNASYTRSISDFITAADDKNRFLKRYVQRQASSFIVPGAVSQFVGVSDDVIRETDNLFDVIKSKIPRASKGLAAKRDAWGFVEKRQNPGPIGSMMPRTKKAEDRHPIDLELKQHRASVTRPNKKVVFDGVRVDLSNNLEAYSRYLELYGHDIKWPNAEPAAEIAKGLRGIGGLNPPNGFQPTGLGLVEELNAIVEGRHPNSIDYMMKSDGPDGTKVEYIDSIVNYYRRVARQVLLEEFPEIADTVQERKARESGSTGLSIFGN